MNRILKGQRVGLLPDGRAVSEEEADGAPFEFVGLAAEDETAGMVLVEYEEGWDPRSAPVIPAVSYIEPGVVYLPTAARPAALEAVEDPLERARLVLRCLPGGRPVLGGWEANFRNTIPGLAFGGVLLAEVYAERSGDDGPGDLTGEHDVAWSQALAESVRTLGALVTELEGTRLAVREARAALARGDAPRHAIREAERILAAAEDGWDPAA